MKKQVKAVIPIIFLLLYSETSYALNLRDIKSICKRTSNYQKCLKEFTNQRHNNKKEELTVIKGPIPIKVIPYKGS